MTMEEVTKNFITNVDGWRITQGYTKEEMARLLEIASPFYSDMLVGRRAVSLREICRMTRIAGGHLQTWTTDYKATIENTETKEPCADDKVERNLKFRQAIGIIEDIMCSALRSAEADERLKVVM